MSLARFRKLPKLIRLSRLMRCLPLIFLSACTDPSFKAERKMPAPNETCGGTAVQSRFIIRHTDGRFEHVRHSSRDEVKEKIIPVIDSVDFVEYDQRIRMQSEWATAPAVEENWGAREVGATEFWLRNLRGGGVIVAVLDTGVDTTHPQLRNQIAYNNDESGDDSLGRDRSTNGIDDDGNGYVDDYLGYDFVSNSGAVSDEEGHGTHVAGIIAAEHSDNEIRTGYIQGVAPSAKILPIKFLDSNGGYLSDALLGIDFAVKRGARVINASWGGTGCSKSLRQKVSDLSAKDILFVVAAGNSGRNLDLYPEYPAAFDLPMQVTVGAIGTTLYPAEFSNYSSSLVHIFAPGTNIVSTVPGGKAIMDGTSMATPFVAGSAALLLSAAPHKSLLEVRNLLLRSVVQAPAYLSTTSGRIYLPNALREL